MILKLLQKDLKKSLFSVKGLALGIVASGVMAHNVQGQSMSNYGFTPSATGSLIDMSSGTTSLLSGTQNASSSTVQSIGFDFYFMGVKYNYFSINADGQMKLHTTSGATAITNNGTTSNAYVASSIVLAPMSGNNRVNGGATYKVTGTPGSRRLVISWNQFTISDITGFTAALLGNMQAWLDENTGVITFMYGATYNSSNSAQNRAAYISSGNTAGQSGLVTIGGIPTYVFDPLSVTPTTSGNFTSNLPATPTTLAENLGSATDGSRVTFTFTPANAPSAAPSGLAGTVTGITTITLNWADNATNELGYNVEYSTDNTNWTSAATVPANTTTYNLTNLLPNTNYYLRVTAFTEGLVSAAATATAQTNACAGLTGTVTVGATGTYPTLTAALSALNTSGFNNSVTLELKPDYVPASETYPVVLSNLLCGNSSNNVTIRPAASVSTPIALSTASAQTINMDGGSYYTIDGRPGGAGTNSMLTLDNTSTSGNSLRFINGAINNTIKYCNVTGVNSSASGGVISFSTSASNAAGNSYNTIANCNITKGSTNPAALLFSSGTTANPNNYNTILNNNFSDFMAATSYGITLSAASHKWTIDGNSLYQSGNTGNGNIITAINIAGSADSIVVRNNYIGGSAPACSGTWNSATATTSNTTRLVGIALAAGTTNAAAVDNNTITNIVIKSSSTGGSGTGIFYGILASSGNVNIGLNTGNTIGSQSANGVISVTNAASVSVDDGGLVGVEITSSGIVNVANNLIGGLSGASGNAGTFRVKGIYCSGATGKKTIVNNTVGGTVANSITSGTTTNTILQDAFGIHYNATATGMIQNNTVRNITAGYSTNISHRAWGIYTTSSGNDTITNNTVYNITDVASNGSVGIFPGSTGTQYVAYNNIYSLIQKGSNASGNAIGIYTAAASGTKTIAYNTIQDIRQDSTTAGGALVGMDIGTAATFNVYNNTINLDYNGAAINNATSVVGIKLPTSNATINNNIIKVNALVATTTKGNSACVVKGSGTPTVTNFNVNNNLYYINDADSNYIFLQGTFAAPTKAFHNNATGTVNGSAIMYDADFNTNCSSYKVYINGLAAGKEHSSFVENIAFVGGTTKPNNLQPASTGASYAQNGGLNLGFTTDILNASVSSTPDMGAIEFNSGSPVAGAGSWLINNSGAANTATGNATATVRLNNTDCELMAQVSSSGASPVTGIVNAQAWIDNGQGNYVKRHTQIQPVTNATTATATVTLYYTQQEFNDFNAGNPLALALPVNASDAAGIANIKIQKLSGASSDGSGAPSTYGTQTTLTPNSAVWNVDSSFWAVTFDVTGFSGFFLNTDPNPTPLPIDWITTTAMLNKQQHAVINWQVNEKEINEYAIQKSDNGEDFNTLQLISSRGNGVNNYDYTEPNVLNGKAWYRIAQTDKDNKTGYSKVMMLVNNITKNQINIYPNPATQFLNIETTQSGIAYTIFNLQGKAVMNGTLQSGKNALNLSAFAKGFYTIKVGEYSQKFVLQ